MNLNSDSFFIPTIFYSPNFMTIRQTTACSGKSSVNCLNQDLQVLGWKDSL